MTPPADPRAVAIGRAVRGALAAADLNLVEAAKRTDMTVSTLSRRVNGAIPFTFPELVELAALTDVPVSDLVATAERLLGKAGAA